MPLQSFVGAWLLFSFLIFYTVCRTPWTGDQPVSRELPAHRTTQTRNKRTQTSMPQVRFEPTIPVFERAKTVHALDHAATVIDSFLIPALKMCFHCKCWHVYQWLKTGYGLVNRFVRYSQVVSTSNYNTVTDFHNTNHSTLIFSVVNTTSFYTHKITVTITHEITSSTSVNTSPFQLPSEFSSTEFSSSELSTKISCTHLNSLV
jgi:hypothetical protein